MFAATREICCLYGPKASQRLSRYRTRLTAWLICAVRNKNDSSATFGSIFGSTFGTWRKQAGNRIVSLSAVRPNC